MADEILDEIQRARQALLKEHGGLEGYNRYVQSLDRAHALRKRRQKATKTKKKAPKRSIAN